MHDPYARYDLEDLLQVRAPAAPVDFDDFWNKAYKSALAVSSKPQLLDTGQVQSHWKILDLRYSSTDGIEIKGWLLLPKFGLPKRALIVGHGYGGRTEPDFHLPFSDTALFFPCCRGISRSRVKPISSNPNWHVLHDIDKKDRYVLKGCVEDIWLAVSAIHELFPYLSSKIGYLGISFCGGIGALALAYEKRISRAHFNVPTFGHHRQRLRSATFGSGKAVQDFFAKHPKIALRTLRYYDAANAAERISVPVHFALALKDHVVAPPGQFAIYNHVSVEKNLYVLHEGHATYQDQEKQNRELINEIEHFFNLLLN